MVQIHSFSAQLATGQKFEQEIKKWLESAYFVTPATMQQQKQGIDFNCRCPLHSTTFTVEVKTDIRAFDTAHVFVETASVVRGGSAEKAGWAYTCQADWIVLFLPQMRQVLLIRPRRLREMIPIWEMRFDAVRALNGDYWSEGRRVPIAAVKEISNYFCRLSDGVPSFEDLK